jgi:hypothetical protein
MKLVTPRTNDGTTGAFGERPPNYPTIARTAFVEPIVCAPVSIVPSSVFYTMELDAESTLVVSSGGAELVMRLPKVQVDKQIAEAFE